MDGQLTIGGREFGSRLILGTGKYDTFERMRDAVEASACELVTVAVRRVDFDAPADDITAFLPDDVLLLPNTAGAETADEAVRMARLARAGGLPDWVKLEVIPDRRYLLPDPVETLRAAEVLLADGFTVLPYMHADPVLARRLEELGCHARDVGRAHHGRDHGHSVGPGLGHRLDVGRADTANGHNRMGGMLRRPAHPVNPDNAFGVRF